MLPHGFPPQSDNVYCNEALLLKGATPKLMRWMLEWSCFLRPRLATTVPFSSPDYLMNRNCGSAMAKGPLGKHGVYKERQISNVNQTTLRLPGAFKASVGRFSRRRRRVALDMAHRMQESRRAARKIWFATGTIADVVPMCKTKCISERTLTLLFRAADAAQRKCTMPSSPRSWWSAQG